MAARMRWRGDGKQLFFLDLEGRVMSAAVKIDGPSFETSSAKLLFQLSGAVPQLSPGRTRYSVSADGQRFLFNLSPPQMSNTPITVTIDWTISHK